MTSCAFRGMRSRWVPLLLLVAASPLAAQQSATTGSFRGRVSDDDGRPIVGAQVVARNEATGFTRGAIADQDGRFLLPLLPPGGPYTVRATSIGYRTLERAGYAVSAGDVVTVMFSLPVEAVQVAGVEVVAGAERIDITQGGVSQRVGAQEIENLPVNGRDFTDFLNLSPLVSPHPEITTGGQFAIGGARSSGTNVQIDGADANNIFFGENRGSSRIPFAFSLESIKEFQLIPNAFDVEHGSYTGGVMNAVTKSGTNELHGSAHYYNRHEKLTAKDFNGADPREFKTHQFGFSLSGPVIRDKLHFFLSVDGQDKAQPLPAGTFESTGINPDSMRRFLDILEQRYGVQNAERYFGNFDQTDDNLVLFGRLDWNLTPNHRLTLRQNFSDMEQANDRIGAVEAITNGGPFRDKVYSTVAELNSIFGSSAFNTLRFQWSYEDRPRLGQEDGGYVPQLTVNNIDGNRRIVFGGDGIVFRNRLEETKLQFIDNFTLRAGAHTFKLGTNNLLYTTENEFWLLGTGSYTFNNLAAFAAGTVANYSRFTRRCSVPLTSNRAGENVICPDYDVPFAGFDALEWSAYAQDDWQMNENLLVTAGVRLTGTQFKDEPGQIPAVEQAFGVKTGVVPDFSGVSPRLSFTYDLGAQQSLVRGGVGLLVGRAPTVVAGNVFQTEKALLSIFCAGAAAPTPDYAEFFSVPRGELNPLACRSGADPTGLAEYSVYSEDVELPSTWKANVGYERLLGSGTRLKLDALFSRTSNNYNVIDLNLRDPDPGAALRAEQDRPIFVPITGYNPRNAAGNARMRIQPAAFARVFQNVSEGEAQAYNLMVELDHNISDAVQLAARYGWNYARDNSSFSCCTSFEGFVGGTSTAGNPNFIGDPGDDEKGTWGSSAFERRHVFIVNGLVRAPWGINVSGTWRSQSGAPFTPLVNGDVNADGIAGNDRAMISKSLRWNSAADSTAFEAHLLKWDCLAEQLGRIAGRNSCRNPWFHSLDLRLSREFPTLGGQRAELLVEAFNVLDGIGAMFCDEEQAVKDATLDKGACGLGDLRAIFGAQSELLRAERYDAASGNVVYTTNRAFGETRPSGFEPFQFQMQVGVRYRF